MSEETQGTVSAVYELREAAVEHGRAMSVLEGSADAAARDRLLETTIVLEKKTSAVLDECGESSAEAVRDVLRSA